MKPFRRLIAAALLLLLLPALFSASAEYSFVSSCPDAFLPEGQVPGGVPALRRSAPREERGIPAPSGTAVFITGADEPFFRGMPGGRACSVLRQRISPRSRLLKKTGLPAPGSLAFVNPLPRHAEADPLEFTGTLRLPDSGKTLFFFFWDELSMSLEKSLCLRLDHPSDRIGGEMLSGLVHAGELRPGRKTLVVQSTAGGKSSVLARLVFAVRGAAEEPAHITGRCTLSIPDVLDDNRIRTRWTPNDSVPSLTIGIPENAGAGLLTLEWYVPPRRFTLRFFDRGGSLVSEETRETGFRLDSVELNDRIASVCLIPEGRRCSLSTVRVYAADYPAFAVQRWQPLPDKVDLMLFSAHEDDEELFFGGIIPYYASAGKTVAVVYLTNDGRERYHEALDGLWTMGLKYHPVFVGWNNGTSEMHHRVDLALGLWKRDNCSDPALYLARLIRQYRPDVVVTHDFNGEYGNIQHRLTARLLPEAVRLAADSSCDTDGELSPWEVKKLYFHLYEKRQLFFDWSRPLNPEQPVFTPWFLAAEAFDKHVSRQDYFSMETYGDLYDNRCFGLFSSTVGEDTGLNDFFENIP